MIGYYHRRLQLLSKVSRLATAHHTMTHSTWKFMSIHLENTTDCAVNHECPSPPRVVCEEDPNREISVDVLLASRFEPRTLELRVCSLSPRVP